MSSTERSAALPWFNSKVVITSFVATLRCTFPVERKSNPVSSAGNLPEALFRELFEDCYATDSTPDDVKAYAAGSAA
jgi:hypothetical protein